MRIWLSNHLLKAKIEIPIHFSLDLEANWSDKMSVLIGNVRSGKLAENVNLKWIETDTSTDRRLSQQSYSDLMIFSRISNLVDVYFWARAKREITQLVFGSFEAKWVAQFSQVIRYRFVISVECMLWYEFKSDFAIYPLQLIILRWSAHVLHAPLSRAAVGKRNRMHSEPTCAVAWLLPRAAPTCAFCYCSSRALWPRRERKAHRNLLSRRSNRVTAACWSASTMGSNNCVNQFIGSRLHWTPFLISENSRTKLNAIIGVDWRSSLAPSFLHAANNISLRKQASRQAECAWSPTLSKRATRTLFSIYKQSRIGPLIETFVLRSPKCNSAIAQRW